METKMFKVSKITDSKALGYIIQQELLKNGKATVQAIGAGSVNQSVKGIIEANKLLGSSGDRAKVIPGYIDVDSRIEGEKITAIKFSLELE